MSAKCLCLVGAAAAGFTGEPASLARDNIFETWVVFYFSVSHCADVTVTDRVSVRCFDIRLLLRPHGSPGDGLLRTRGGTQGGRS